MADSDDQSRAVGTLPQPVRRDFSSVGYDEAMRRTRSAAALYAIVVCELLASG
jgi:hypothetical protein